MFVVRRLSAAAAVATLALTLVGCTDDGSDSPAQPAPSSTPLRDFATQDLSVVRGEFCPRIAPEAVADALHLESGAEPEDAKTWANGDRVELADGVRDVAHEYGCSWTGSDGTVARAWVFAPPVPAARARELGRAAGRTDGCRARTDAPAYGAPSIAVSCRASGERTTAFHGLFGDAWLSCSLTASTEPDLDRTGRWCVAVAQAAAD